MAKPSADKHKAPNSDMNNSKFGMATANKTVTKTNIFNKTNHKWKTTYKTRYLGNKIRDGKVNGMIKSKSTNYGSFQEKC